MTELMVEPLEKDLKRRCESTVKSIPKQHYAIWISEISTSSMMISRMPNESISKHPKYLRSSV